MIDYSIRINLQGERVQYENIVFTTGDKRGYRLNFAFYSGGSRMDVSGYVLAVKARRADGEVILDSGETEEKGAYYIVADNAYNVEGLLEFEVALVGPDESLATVHVIRTQVREGFGEAGLAKEDNAPIMAKIVAATEAAVTAAEAVQISEEHVKAYADGKDTVVLEQAEMYADGKDEQVLETSKAYADEKDVEVLAGAKAYADEKFANAFTGQKSGEAIRLDDVSPLSHNVSVKARSKNLWDKPKLQLGWSEVDGGYSFLRPEGYTGGTYLCLSHTINVPKGTTVTFSFTRTGGISRLYLYDEKVYGKVLKYTDKSALTYTATKDVNIMPCIIADSSQSNTTVLDIQFEMGNEVTEYVPHMDITNTEVIVSGRNLLNVPNELSVPSYRDVVCSQLRAGVSYKICMDAAIWDAEEHNAVVVKLNDDVGTKVYLNNAGEAYIVTPETDCGGIRVYASGYSNSSGVTATIQGLRLYATGNGSNIDYEPYCKPVTYAFDANGYPTEEVISFSPGMTLTMDTPGVIMDCSYNKDSNKVIEKITNAIISLGGNV